MKALIISDIHSNIEALQAIYEREKDCDIIYCAGDLVDMGPFPREVIAWVQKHDVICVKGNHDQKVIDAFHREQTIDRAPPEERDWLAYNAGIVTKEDVRFLENLPEKVTFEMDGFPYLMGHLYRKYEMILSEEQFLQYWKTHTEGAIRTAHHKRCIFGHTHRRMITYYNDSEMFLNPGSISYNKGYLFAENMPYTPISHYITIVDGEMLMHSIKYDRSGIIGKATELLQRDGGVSERCQEFTQLNLL